MSPRTWWTGLAGRRRVFVVGVAVLCLIAGAVAAVRLAGGSVAEPGGTPAQDRPGPVLLVPGYGGSRESLAPLAARLRAAGRDTTVLTLPGDGTGDLLAQVAVLDAAVNTALAHGAPSVDLVGYSAGGVVVRLWVDRDGGQHRVRRVVTLGSPLHGANIAAVGSALVPGACPVACQQLAPGSALLRGIDATPLPPGLPWVSVWSQDDQTVTPPDSARLPGAVNVPLQGICPGAHVAHGSLPSDPLPVGITVQVLDDPAVTTPTPARCSALTRLGS